MVIPAHIDQPSPKLAKNSLRGVGFMLFGVFLFSAVDTLAKYLTLSLHPIQVTWSRQIGLFIGVLIVFAIRGPSILRTNHRALQISRGALAAGSATLFIMAVSYVPIADAVAVSFVAPFIVTVLGAVVLGEYVGARRWVAIGIGFLATLIVIRPGMGVIHPAVGLVLLAAMFYAFRQILSRKLSVADPTITTVSYTALTATFLVSIPLPFVWTMPAMGLEIALLIAMTLLAALPKSW